MRALTSADLIGVWERGASQPPVKRALLLLACAYPDLGDERLSGLSIGQRDTYLLMLREQAFGTRIDCQAECPACAERLELDLSTSALRREVMEPFASGTSVTSATVMRLDHDGWQIEFRLPTSADLIDLGESVAEARAHVLQRCLLSVRDISGESSIIEIPPAVLTAVEQRMSEADPLADIQFDLHCPACTHRWQAPFDILGFLWNELTMWVRRTVRDVHILARAYGWRESDILALTSHRRRLYLDLVAG